MDDSEYAGPGLADVVFTPEVIRRRKDFLRVAAAVGAGIVLDFPAIQFLFGTPLPDLAVDPERPENSQNLYPAAAELRVGDVAFFNTNSGHQDFVHELARTPEIQPLVQGLFAKLMTEYHDENIRLELGQILQIGMEFAQTAIIESYPETPRGRMNQEVIHLTTILLATIFSKWNNTEQAEEILGRNLDQFESVTRDHICPTGYGRVMFPRLWGGIDKTMHFMQYMFLAFEFKYLQEHLPEAIRFPRFVEAIRSESMSDEEQIRFIFGEIVSWLYEVVSTTYFYPEFSLLTPSTWPAEQARLKNEGIFDSKKGIDVLANKLGIEVGIWLFNAIKQGKTWREIIRFFQQLDDPKWQGDADATLLDVFHSQE